MNPKDENVPPVSRFGFRFQLTKNSSDKKQNGDFFVKNSSRHASQSNPTQNLSSKHLIKQQTFVAEKDSRKKKPNTNELLTDSTASNDSNSSLQQSKPSTGSNIKKTSISNRNCSRGHLLQVSDPVASRRSRSRDACRELMKDQSKETVKVRRDQSLKPIKSRSKSREHGLKSADVKLAPLKKSSDDKHSFKTKSSAADKINAKCSTPNAEIKSSNVSNNSCTIRDSENNVVEQESLKSDLNFLKKKLMELKSVLTVGTTCPGERSVSSIKEENYLLREENALLKEKIKELEQDLELKFRQINKMNDKCQAQMQNSSFCNEDGVNNLHDSSINISNQYHTSKTSHKKRSSKILRKDSNENISCIDDSSQNHDTTLLNETLTDASQFDPKFKRASQLPTRPLAKKSLAIPKKFNDDKVSPSGFASTRQFANSDSKKCVLQADNKSQRMIK